MKNYHGEEVNFEIGAAVSCVMDSGEIAKGTVKSISGELLEIEFEDGECGFENASQCF